MAINTILVNNVAGNAWVRQADGSLLALRAGMRVSTNAEVVTDSGASVQLQADGMPPLTVGENRQFQVTDELTNTDMAPEAQTLPAQVDPDTARVLAALQAGEDPFEQLAPTAAVTSGGGDGAGGSSFTRLMSIVESTSPLALAYPKPLDPAGELPRMGGYARADGSDNNEEPTAPISPTTPTLKVIINNDGTVSFNFSEKPVGFDATDVRVSNGGRIENLRPDPTDPTKWVADLIVPDNYDGDVVVRVPDGSYTNDAGVPGLGDQDNITVNTLPPEAEITITTIAGDGVLDKKEAQGTVEITGTVGKEVKANDTVTLTVDGKTIGTATVNADGKTWTATVNGADLLGHSTVKASVTTTDSFGKSATATTNGSYSTDITPPEAEITITTIAGDGVLDKKEAQGTVEITGTVGKEVKANDTVTLTVDGKTIGTATVNADGKTWTATVNGADLLGHSTVKASVTTTDSFGKSATATTNGSYLTDIDTGGDVGCNGNVVCSTNYLGYSKNPDVDPAGSLNTDKDVGFNNYMEFSVRLNTIEERNGEHFVAGEGGKAVLTQELLGGGHQYIKLSLHASDKIFGNSQNELNRTGVETETDVTVNGAIRSNAIQDGEYPWLIQGVGDKSNEVYVRADVWNEYAKTGISVNVNHDGGKDFVETEWKLGARYEPDINNPQKDEDGNVKYPLDNHPANGAELDNGNRVMEGDHDSQYAFSDTVNLKPVGTDPTQPEPVDSSIEVTLVERQETKETEITLKDDPKITIRDGKVISDLHIEEITSAYHSPLLNEIIYISSINHHQIGSVTGTLDSSSRGTKYVVLEGSPDRYTFSNLELKTGSSYGSYYNSVVTDKTGETGLNDTTFAFIKGFIFTDGTVIEDGVTTKYGSSFMEYDFALDAVLGDDAGTESGIFLSFTGLSLEQISKLSISKDGQELQWKEQDGKVFIPNTSSEDLEGINIHVVVPKTEQTTNWSISAELQAKDGSPITSDSAASTDTPTQASSLSHEHLDELSPAHLLHEEDELGLFLSTAAEHDNTAPQNEKLNLSHDENTAENRLELADILGTPKDLEGLEPSPAPSGAQRTADTVVPDQDKDDRAANTALQDDDQASLMHELGKRLMDEGQKLNNPDL